MLLQREDNGDYTLSQQQYASDIVAAFTDRDTRPAATPLTPGIILPRRSAEDPQLSKQQHTRYRAILGKLTHAANTTRPDLMHAISVLGSFAADPSQRHLEELQHLLRYLKATTDLTIRYTADNTAIVAWSDASFQDCPDSRRSRSCIIITVANGPVAWISRKQGSVATSTCQAELTAMSLACEQSVYMHKLARAFDMPLPITGMPMHVDCAPAFDAATHRDSKASKYFHTRQLLVREFVTRKDVALLQTPTQEMLADLGTKSLPKPRFITLRNRIINAYE